MNSSRTSQGLLARSGSPASHCNELTELAAFVFEDVEPSTGAGAIVSVKTFLDRLDKLENDKDRKAARKVDHAALEKRGIPAAERARLRKLIEMALGASTKALAPTAGASSSSSRSSRAAPLP